MKIETSFSLTSVDYFGYVSPNFMMREINEGVGVANYEDGVGFSHLFPTVGVTWMMGQCVLEFKKLLPCQAAVEIRCSGREQFGVTTVRRCVMKHKGEEVMRLTAKLLPVYFEARKIAPPEVLAPFWKSEAQPCGEPLPFLVPPASMETVERYPVRFRDCDSNLHMTAFRYLDLILETVGYWNDQPRLLRRVQIDYKKECVPGEILELRYARQQGIHYCSGIKEDGSVSFHASVQMSEETYPRGSILHG